MLKLTNLQKETFLIGHANETQRRKSVIRNITNLKYFKKVMIMVIVAVIFFGLGIIILKYHVEGETNMPFKLSKIAIISSGEGIDKETSGNRWAFDVYQSNDVFLYIDKNGEYRKTEAIKNIVIDNIQIEAKQKDKINIYRPEEKEEKLIFKNKKENIVEKIEYLGSMESNIKQLKISNQGGLVAFRVSIDNLATYQSNEEEIKHQDLLKKTGVNQEDLETKLTFDLKIALEEGNEYKSTINLDFPIGNVIEKGMTSTEITDMKDIIFKRM